MKKKHNKKEEEDIVGWKTKLLLRVRRRIGCLQEEEGFIVGKIESLLGVRTETRTREHCLEK